MKLENLPASAQAQARRKLAAQGGAAPASSRAVRKISPLEMLFDAHLARHGKDLPAPIAECEFDTSGRRKFRFDRAWPSQKVAVELDGGVMSGGRHVRPGGFEEDCAKLNLAAVQGWIVLRFTSQMVAKDPLGCLDLLRLALASRRQERDR